ncbi:MAG: CvpA family protein [Panacagrimonas sp.]
MNWADYGILGFIVLSTLVGFLRGFMREFFGLGTWILALLLCVFFGHEASALLTPYFSQPLVRTGVGYGGLFLGGLLIGGIVTSIMVARVRQSRFSSADRTLGSGLGFVRGVLVVGLVVLLAGTAGLGEKEWWKQSSLVSPARVVADGLDVLIPDAWLAPLKPDVATPSGPVREASPPSAPADSV